jgi:hypothetical protein
MGILLSVASGVEGKRVEYSFPADMGRRGMTANIPAFTAQFSGK